MILSPKPADRLPTTRFAPSPTGLLHLGHAFSALCAWHRIRPAGGRFVLRIEDIDAQRCRSEFADAIQADLAWLGLDWDGPVRLQSQHEADYRAVLDRLCGEGLLYPCFCSRAAILREFTAAGAAPHVAPDGSWRYPGTCRRLDRGLRDERLQQGAPHALRLDCAAALRRLRRPLHFEDADAGPGQRLQPCDGGAFGDVVLARRDTATSYHLCSTHDDWLEGISLVVRGEDLRPIVGLHRLLQELSGWTAPSYSHHHLLRDAQGRRLSKRDHAQTLQSLRAQGKSASEVRAAAGFLL